MVGNLAVIKSYSVAYFTQIERFVIKKPVSSGFVCYSKHID